MSDPLQAPAMLSPHLSLAEFTATAHREFLEEQDSPPAQVLVNARRFAVDVFEPARALVGPLRVTSGYRCPGLNAAIGGAASSAHMEGLAADVVPTQMSLLVAFLRLQQMLLPADQLIYELGRWIHIAAPHHSQPPRRQALMCFRPGHYEPFDPHDRRLA